MAGHTLPRAGVARAQEPVSQLLFALYSHVVDFQTAGLHLFEEEQNLEVFLFFV